MNGNRPMEMYYGYPNPYNNTNHNHQQQQQHQHQQVVNESSYIGMGMGMGLGMNMSMSMGMGMDFFDGYHQQPPLVPPPNYIYPHHHLPIPMHSQDSAAYWSMNMNNSYRSNYPDSNIGIGSTPSDYGYQINDALPRTEVNRRTWEYSSSMHIEEPTIDHMHHQHQPSPEHVVVSTSDAAQDCPLEGSDTASPEAAWQDDIDPDNMTYEELLDLGEAVGTQSRGLSNELIKLLPTSRFKAGGFFSRKKSKERCVICLVTYKIGDQQMTLPCKHVYHSKCGRKWLSINKTCPVCNSEVFGDEGRN